MKLIGYKIYFWSNENGEPIHIHVSKGHPIKNSTKIWLTKSGNCVLENNKSRIPQNDLSMLMDIISKHYFIIVSKWKEYYNLKNIDEIKFYC